MYTFKKKERLCSRKVIEKLFSTGNSFFCYPFRVIWLETETDSPYPAQMAVSVSRKKIRKAVKRNLVKRRVRESYRLQKGLLYKTLKQNNKKMVLTFIYTQSRVHQYRVIEKGVKEAVIRLAREIAEKHQ